METIIRGKCIFLSPLKSSISSLDKSSEAISKIDINDFISTVAKIVIPLSVMDSVNTFKSIFATVFPPPKNGIKIEIKKGYKNTTDILFISNPNSGLNRNTTIIAVKK